MNNHIFNFALFPQVQVTNYKPICGFRLAALPDFWTLLNLPFLTAVKLLLLHKAGHEDVLKHFSETPPALREVVGYNRVQIDLDDIVEKTYKLIDSYQRLHQGRLPTLMLVGHKDYIDIKNQLAFHMPDSYRAHLRTGSHWYRNMRIVLTRSIDGIVLIGEDELNGN